MKDEKGFTLLSMLFGLIVIVIIFPLLIQVFKNVSQSTFADDLSYQQFFLFLRQEKLHSVQMYERNNVIYFQLEDHRTSMLEKYEDIVRRRVDEKGHEVFLRDVAEFQTKTLDYGIKVIVKSIEGEVYEKTIPFEG